ncbi:MAG: type II secretion system ATPase GspE [Rhabdochlamydiaceae bacterium]|jgi:general secretion pathway protein E
MIANIESLCHDLKIPYVKSLQPYVFVQKKAQKVPYTFAKNKCLLPLEEDDSSMTVAVSDPLDLDALEEVRYLVGKQIHPICASIELIKEAIESCYGQKEDATKKLIATLREKQTSALEEEEGYDLLEQTSDSSVIRLLNALLTEAIQQEASDIHFEPMEQGLEVRYRIDGVLQMRHAPPKDLQMPLITRIKVLTRMDIAENRLPQDGRIKLKIGGRGIDFRVSTIPVVYGERVVLRILDKSNVVVGLHKLGMRGPILHEFKKMIAFSEGIVLVTGPTGSGKTTTLYSAISEINSSEINIMSIEDPVEYKLQGMAQVGVNPKIHLDFATGLRHILRQDPDVIMIGEIRDRETAEIAIQSSLTGHLVLSTLHTNDAPSALTRLIDMGIEPYLLSSSVIGILAQRLVRTICPTCKVTYTPSNSELRDLGLTDPVPFYRGEGCANCFQSGYKGRHGIYELMTMSNGIKKQLLKSGDAVELRECALAEGMSSLRIEGAHLVIQGITTTTEVLRVSRSCSEE